MVTEKVAVDRLEGLVVAAQAGDDEAFGRLVEAFQDVAVYTALRYVDNAQQAQDAAQEAFIEAYRCLHSLREPRAFPAWLQRIVFKHCDRQTRKRRPLPLAPELLSEIEAGMGGPEYVLERMQQYQALRAAVRALPDIYRQVTELFYFKHLSYSEVVIHLNVPLSTVKKRLYTARHKLQEKMRPMDTTQSRPSQNDALANRVKFNLALKNDDLLQVRQLLRRQPDLLEARTEWGVASDGWYWPLGTTALHWAAGTGSVALAELLLEQGAEVDVRARGGATPLHRAAHMGQAEMVQWLLQQGADASVTPSSSLTPLHVAVIQNRPAVVRALLQYGADPQREDDNGRSPRDWAALKDWPQVAEELGVARVADETRARPAGGPLGDGRIWETGVKIIDLVAPLKWGGRNGIFTPISGIGVDVMLAELMQRMALYEGGITVQAGLEHGDFTAKSRELMWRNCAVAGMGRLFFGQASDSAARKRHLAQQAVDSAQSLSAEKPVLFMIYTHLALVEGVMEDALSPIYAEDDVTVLFVGTETVGAEPAALAELDAALTFSRARAKEGLWPAIDPLRSYSTGFAHAHHETLAREAGRLIRRYQDLEIIYENQGMSGFDMALYGDAERNAVRRARRLHRFLSQPLLVAEPWTALPAEFVPLTETLGTTQAILDGELDEVPEEDLMFISTWSPRWT